ncbi:VOC family protein [Nakamurella sp. YIM 132087]|uniref:VOC family protein n=1 Tax=Nakamurella alba TaxID=2665158 RepID=A0A7K1FGM8_9ACTN|nr:VOC family protein [Nakamurella alba]
MCLPTEDRGRAHAFYAGALGLDTIGPIAEDGLPEPLQFVVNDGLRLMLIPTGGFGWTIGDRTVAGPGVAEVQLSLAPATSAEVDELLAKAQAGGGSVVTPPQQQPWGYSGSFADPDGHLWMLVVEPS